MSTEAEIAEQVNRLVRAKTGDDGATVGPLSVLPGHAGLSYSFEISWTSHGDVRREKLVLRLAPEGVRTAGPADVVRQARVMASLEDTKVPVPPVRWFDNDPRWFGRSFFVAAFVAGDKLTSEERTYTAQETTTCVRAAVETLAELHRVPWEPRSAGWGEPSALDDVITSQDKLLDRPTLEPALVVNAPRLRARLLATIPDANRTGCVHGDYQWSNCLFEQGRLVAVIDWELSQVSAVLMDLGWISLFSDRESWVQTDLLPKEPISPEEIAEIYRERAGYSISDHEIKWFRAFAGYRFGVITAFNLMLHRRGKRPDATWEDIALSGPRFFERGLELIG